MLRSTINFYVFLLFLGLSTLNLESYGQCVPALSYNDPACAGNPLAVCVNLSGCTRPIDSLVFQASNRRNSGGVFQFTPANLNLANIAFNPPCITWNIPLGAANGDYGIKVLLYTENAAGDKIVVSSPIYPLELRATDTLTTPQVTIKTDSAFLTPNFCPSDTFQFIVDTRTNAGPAPTFSWLLNGSPFPTSIVLGSPDNDTLTVLGGLLPSDQVSTVMFSSLPCLTKRLDTSNVVDAPIFPNPGANVSILIDSGSGCQDSVTRYVARYVSATGDTTPVRYQWFLNSIPLTSPTLNDSIYRVSSAQANIANTLRVRVTDPNCPRDFFATSIYNFLPCRFIIIDDTASATYCAGDTVSVPYIVNAAFQPGNTFTLQLSNDTANPASWITIGSRLSSLGGNIEGILPPTLPFDNDYCFRVVGSNPSEISLNTLCNITINTKPANPVLRGDTICNSGDLTFISTGCAETRWFNSLTASTPIFVGDTLVQTISTPGTYTFYAECVNPATGCRSNRVAVNGLVAPLPILSAGPSPDSVCFNFTSYTLSGYSVTNGLPGTGAWKSVDPAFSACVAPSGIVNPSCFGVGSFGLRYVFTSSLGCIDSIDKTLEVIPLPSITTSNDTTLCLGGGPITLSASPVGGTWNGPSGVFNASTAQFTPSAIGSFELIYSFSQFGCIGRDTVTVTVAGQPDFTINTIDPSICDSCLGIASVVGPGISPATHTIAWYSGPNLLGVGNPIGPGQPVDTGLCSDPSKTGGPYRVEVTNNSTGCTRTRSLPALNDPGASQVALITSIEGDTFCINEANILLAADSTPVAFSSGLIVTGPNTAELDPDSFSVGANSISVSHVPASNCAGGQTYNFTIVPSPVFSLNSPADTACPTGFPLTLTATILDVFSSGNWVEIPGTFPGSPLLNAAGVFNPSNTNLRDTVVFAVFEARSAGCTERDSIGIYIERDINASLDAPSGNSVCAGDCNPLVVNGLPTAPSNFFFQWFRNGTAIPGAAGVAIDSICANLAGNYTVEISYINSACTFTLGPQSITVNPFPVVNAGPDRTVCFGQDIALGAPGAGCSWSGSFVSPSGVFQSALSPGIGIYEVYQTCVSGGCAATDTVEVSVQDIFTFSVDTTNSTTCLSGDGTATITPPLPPGHLVSWSTGANSAFIDSLSPGVYSATVTTPGGCPNTVNFSIGTNQLASFTVNAPFDTVCRDRAPFLIAGLSNAIWAPSTYVDSTGIFDPAAAFALGGEGWYKVFASQVIVNCTLPAPPDSIYVGARPLLPPRADTTICRSNDLLTLSLPDPSARFISTYVAPNGNFVPSNVPTTVSSFINIIELTRNGCVVRDTFSIFLQDLPRFNVTATSPTACGTSDGSISIAPIPPSANYSYLWTASGITSKDRTGLASGLYNLRVTDNITGCVRFDTIAVNDPGFNVAINPLPSNICKDEPFVLLSSTPSTGTFTYSGPGVRNDTLFPGDPSVIAGTPFNIFVSRSDGGCSAFDSISVTVNPLPQLLVSSSLDTICVTGTTTLSASVLNGVGGTGTWTIGAPAPLGTVIGSTYFPSNGMGGDPFTVNANNTLFYTHTSAGGCTQTASVNVFVKPEVDFTFTTTSPTTCGGNDGTVTVNVIAPTTGAQISYRPMGTNPNALSAGTYFIDVVDTVTGCSRTRTLIINDPAGTPVNLSNVPQTACAGDTILLSGLATPSGGTFSPSATAIITNAPYIYSYSFTDANGCTTVLDDTIDVVNGNVSILPASSLIQCQDPTDTITLTASTSGTVAATNFVWSTNSAALTLIPNGNEVRIPLDVNGTFSISVTATFGSCDITATETLEINPAPNFNFRVNNKPFPCGTPTGNVSLTGLTPPLTNYDITWRRDSSTGPIVWNTANFTVAPAGNYFVTVRQLFGDGCELTRAFSLLDSTATVPPRPAGLPLEACPDDPNVAIAPVTCYETTPSSLNPAIFTPGTFAIFTTIDTCQLCFSNRIDSVFIKQNNAPLLSQTSATICSDQTTYNLIEVSAQPGVFFRASDPTKTGCISGTIADLACFGEGTHTIEVCFPDGPERCEECAKFQLTINNPPNVNPGPSLTVCKNDAEFNLLTNATPNFGVSIVPPFPPGVTADAANGLYLFDPTSPDVSPTTAGNPYLITYVWNVGTCIDTAVRAIFVTSAPESISDTVVCRTSGTFQLNGIPEGGVWSSPDCPGSISPFGVVTPPDNEVECTYLYSFNGTSCEESLNVTFADEPVVTQVLPSRNIALLEGDSVQVDVSVNAPGLLFDWNPKIGVRGATTQNPTFSPEETTTYQLTIINPLFGAAGCETTTEVTIIVSPNLELVIADAFSPNGDDKYDTWEINNISNHPNAEIKVFNRWGGLVYEATGSELEDPGKRFDGTDMDGNELPVGVYFYTIDNLEESREPLTGDITLVR